MRAAKSLLLTLVLMLLLAGSRASAYSVLAHEANVDAAWDEAIRPLLLRRFPRATAADIRCARAYAYGGSVIQDLGYYPFGSRFFSDLVHYVRSGDFVETLIRDARTLDEYAFALGALSHYAADTVGHPVAVNRAVPLVYPKLRAKYGNEVTYVESPSAHVLVEFSFDVVHVASGRFLPQAFHDFIGFEVAKPVLERAFRDTYGLDLDGVFLDVDLAIGTYRRAVSQMIPRVTEVAWREKRDAIARIAPTVDRQHFVFQLSRHEYEQRYGTRYRKPGFLTRVVGVVYKIVPKIGPLRPLSFKTPTPEAEALFVRSLTQTASRYRQSLASIGSGRLNLINEDFDTGRLTRYGEYPLADRTYAKLVDKLLDADAPAAPPALRSDITRFYDGPPRAARQTAAHRDRVRSF